MSVLVKQTHSMALRPPMGARAERIMMTNIPIHQTLLPLNSLSSQTQYVRSVLARFDMETCKPAKSPLPAKCVLTKRKEGEAGVDATEYLKAIGSLMYAMLGTRPDLAFAIGLLARFSSDPSSTHWSSLVHVLRYLQHTKDLGIVGRLG